jgi:periplasmic protein TonB
MSKLNFKTMLISKFDLYKPEWLELVFDDRNKEYGAYDLRKHYDNTLVKSLAITLFSVSLLFTAQHFLSRPKPVEFTRTINNIPIIPRDAIKPPITPPKIEPPKPHVEVNTVKFPPPVIAPDQDAADPPKIIELQTAAIGQKTVKGPDDGASIDIPETGTVNGIAKVTEDNTPREMNSVEILPQPVGGTEAWAKFLQKNMHYPPMASDAHTQGKVFFKFCG